MEINQGQCVRIYRGTMIVDLTSVKFVYLSQTSRVVQQAFIEFVFDTPVIDVKGQRQSKKFIIQFDSLSEAKREFWDILQTMRRIRGGDGTLAGAVPPPSAPRGRAKTDPVIQTPEDPI